MAERPSRFTGYEPNEEDDDVLEGGNVSAFVEDIGATVEEELPPLPAEDDEFHLFGSRGGVSGIQTSPPRAPGGSPLRVGAEGLADVPLSRRG